MLDDASKGKTSGRCEAGSHSCQESSLDEAVIGQRPASQAEAIGGRP